MIDGGVDTDYDSVLFEELPEIQNEKLEDIHPSLTITRFTINEIDREAWKMQLMWWSIRARAWEPSLKKSSNDPITDSDIISIFFGVKSSRIGLIIMEAMGLTYYETHTST